MLRVKPEGITANEIASGAVTTAEILDGTILTGDISLGGVTSNNILDGTILTGDISVGGVTTLNILNGTILGQDIAPSNTVNQVLTTTVASTTVAWTNPATLTTVLQDGDADTKVTVDVGGVDEDHIRLTTFGTERMTIDNTGQIGIGTNTPDRDLHVTNVAGGVIMVTRNDNGTTAGETLGEIQFDSEDNTNPSSVEASAVIRGLASETHGNSNKGGHLAFATKTGGGTSGGSPATERMRITNTGNVGIGLPNPAGKLHVEGDFHNQELTGKNVYNAAQTVAYNANTVVDLGSVDHVIINKADGNGINGSSILIVASATVSGNDIQFADGVGGYQNVQSLMNGIASFTILLQKSTDSGGTWTTLTRQSAVCGIGVGDWYTQYNGIANMSGKHGDEFRFPNSVSISYFDDPADGTIWYRLRFEQGGSRKNGGSYQITDRNLTAVQIKR